MRYRRLAQGLSLLLFLGLLAVPAGTWPERPDLFLRMDPLVLLVALTHGSAPLGRLVPGLAVILLTLVLGRFFCSFVCPLGTTIDAGDALLARVRKRAARKGPRMKGERTRSASFAPSKPWRYVFLAFITGSVIAGSSLLLLFSPVSLATRFYGLVLSPLLASLLDLGALAAREAGGKLGIGALEYLSVSVPAYSLAWTALVMMAFVLGLGLIAPRFWCRHLCPAGAVLSLCSMKRYLKREVSGACTDCGACAKACPMGAVDGSPREADSAGCIVCGRCREVCRPGAVRFSFKSAVRSGSDARPEGAAFPEGGGPAGRGPGFSKARRLLLLSGVAGAGGALLTLPLPGPLRALHPGAPVLRPPGALPENAFLASCVRCGECVKVCPTTALQPAGPTAGVSRFFSPLVAPRTGPCEPSCTRCGQACPTGAVRALPPEEKICAKIGTAVIVRHRCIAWEDGKACLVCDEVCPFGAIDLKRVEGKRTAVPFVDPSCCNGCGYCEYHCPVAGSSAVVVSPDGSLRMERGSFVAEARAKGLKFEVKLPSSGGGEPAPSPGEGDLPPGFEK